MIFKARKISSKNNRIIETEIEATDFWSAVKLANETNIEGDLLIGVLFFKL